MTGKKVMSMGLKLCLSDSIFFCHIVFWSSRMRLGFSFSFGIESLLIKRPPALTVRIASTIRAGASFLEINPRNFINEIHTKKIISEEVMVILLEILLFFFDLFCQEYFH